MFAKILVAVDKSAMNRNVFAKAIKLAKDNDSDLMFLHVLSVEEQGSPMPYIPSMTQYYPGTSSELNIEVWQEQWQEFQKEGLEMLQAFAAEARKADLQVEYRQVAGSPSRNVCTIAREWQADLIVIGRRGRSGLSEMLLGSVSNYVVHHAPCSVLIVQEEAKN
ncbi:MAG: universal stress protein [Prochloraceae cyanobacterium]|nr:universal stress protein [Prochloraceae cyanobacterium]